MPRTPSPVIAKRQAERDRIRRQRTARRMAKLTALTPDTAIKSARYVAIHADASMFNAVVALLESTHPTVTVTTTTEN